ncbi:MAG TPA: ABC transporter ATP-binding protein [Planctomycetota bacterium]|nr:ABC transporter ATP-binding protein [Planctomycetota bacterium]
MSVSAPHAMIEVEHLYRRYGQVLAVEDLTFRLEKGEVVGFLGPNGAGKTTTMRILAGYLPASKATRLSVAGFDVLRQSIEVRRRIGYLPESVPLYRELRVREMLRFHGRLHGMDRASLAKAIPRVLDRVGVLDRREQLVGNLSRGLRQRVGLAVALLPNPDVLILDEPTSGLDPLQRKEVRSLIGALAQDHTVLLSSHILAEIELICPRVIILDRGKLLADGTQRQLLHQLAGDQRIRLEAMCGSDVEAARRSLAALPGVASVVVGERVGIHQAFELRGEGDLREDVGALAMQKGWALRELSLTRATLEEVFSKLVLGELGTAASPALAPAPPAAQSGTQSAPTNLLQLALPDAKVPSDPGSKPGGAIYSLNPFDRGASRDLSKPVPRDPEPPSDPEGCDQ